MEGQRLRTYLPNRFVSGHGFSRAVRSKRQLGLQRLYRHRCRRSADEKRTAASHRMRFTKYSTSDKITLSRMEVISGK